MTRLSDTEREEMKKDIARLEEWGDKVGSWDLDQVQCHQKSLTMTARLDKPNDPLDLNYFAIILCQSPVLLLPALRRLLEMDEALTSLLAVAEAAKSWVVEAEGSVPSYKALSRLSDALDALEAAE